MLQNRLSPAQDVPPSPGGHTRHAGAGHGLTNVLNPAPALSPSSRAWILVPATFALAAVVSFAGFYLRIAASSVRSSTRGVALRKAQLTDLGMQLTARGGQVLVSWNRGTPAVKTATYGLLSVDDGADHHRLDLPPQELAKGSLLYKPASQNVTFRLEIHGSGGTLISGVARTLGAPSLPPQPIANATAEMTQRIILPDLGFDSDRAGRKNPEGRAVPVYVAPKPLQEVIPNIQAEVPSQLREPVHIQLEIKIDVHGKVASASVLAEGTKRVDPVLVAAAIAAAKQWIFQPAQLGGTSVPSDHIIEFHFRPNGR